MNNEVGPHTMKGTSLQAVSSKDSIVTFLLNFSKYIIRTQMFLIQKNPK